MNKHEHELEWREECSLSSGVKTVCEAVSLVYHSLRSKRNRLRSLPLFVRG